MIFLINLAIINRFQLLSIKEINIRVLIILNTFLNQPQEINPPLQIQLLTNLLKSFITFQFFKEQNIIQKIIFHLTRLLIFFNNIKFIFQDLLIIQKLNFIKTYDEKFSNNLKNIFF